MSCVRPFPWSLTFSTLALAVAVPPGSYRARILATPVDELFGEKGFGSDLVKDMKWVQSPLRDAGTPLAGEFAFRPHNGGQKAGLNFAPFFDWIDNYIKAPPLSATANR